MLRLTLLKYRATDYDTQTSGRSLQVIGDPNGIPLFGLDEVGAPKVPLWTGMPEVKAADYDGDGRDDLAIAYAATPVGKPLTGYLGVVSLTATLGLRGQATTTVNGSPLYDGGASNDGAYGTDVATRGMQLAPGLFRLDPASGYKIDRRQLAAAWTEQPGPNSLATYVSVFSINPSPSCSLTACTFAFSEITPRSGGTTKLQQTDNAPLSSQQYPLPLSLAAGGFKGRDGTTPKTWGLALSVNDDGEHAGPSNSDPRLFMLDVAGNAIKTLSQQDLYTDQQAEPASYSLTAFDATGASLQLGAPAVVTITNLSKASMIAAQPPSHSDWSPTLDNFINVSRIGSFSVALGSSSTTSYQHTTTHDSNWNGGFSFSNDAKASFNFDEGVAAESGSVEGKTDLATKWFGTSNDLESYSSASSTSLTQRGDDDDLVRADITNSTVYRYPILGGTAKNPDGTPVTGYSCSPTCYGIYEVVVPGRVQNLAGGGRSMDFYQPSWENGNALSYPVTNSNDPPPADLGGYSYYGADGQLHTNSSVLLDQNFGVGGTSGTVNLNITSQTGNGNTTSHGNNWQLSDSIAVSLGARIGTKLENASAQDTATFSGTGGQEFVTNDSGDTTDSSGSSLQVDVPAIESNDGYQINAKYYYDTAGAARVAFSDNLTADAEGRNWWEDEYGQQPDPALNLPNSTFLTFDQFNVLHIPKFTTQADAQAIRGFKVTHPTDTTAPNVAPGAIYADNPVVGDKVVFQVPVNNYSLVPATNVPVDFYAVPMTGDNVPKIAGPAVHLGTTQTIPRIDPQGTQVVSQAWTASALPGVQGQQLWRIFVVLDRNGSISEIHPWQGGTTKNGPPYLGGAPCPKSALNPQPGPGEVDMKSKNVWVMIDPMTGKDSTLACGQNNQGYGTVTVSVTAPNPQSQGLRNSTVLGMVAAKAAVPAGVQFAGAGLADGNPGHNLLGANAIPTVPAGQFVTGIGYASTTTDSIEHQPVIVYDGPPAADNEIAVTTLNGVDNVTGGHATFTWQAKNPGLHTIHLRLLGTPTAGADDDQEFKIMVTAPSASAISTSSTSASAGPGQSAQSAGQLVNTGSGPVVAMLAVAVALLSVGIGVVAATRRRRPSRLR